MYDSADFFQLLFVPVFSNNKSVCFVFLKKKSVVWFFFQQPEANGIEFLSAWEESQIIYIYLSAW